MTAGIVLLVSGDRNWSNVKRLYAVLDGIHAATPVRLLIEGGARGADRMARSWAIERKVPYKTFDAKWSEYGRSAGPIRNREQFEKGRPDRLAAFHDEIENSTGTKDMIAVARKGGCRVTLFTSKTEKEIK